ncbi:MAG TPA: DNA alkylation repair protein [Acidimicrobiia bacterium]|nr:DNA alkylation repair protein [Acidimicrobiia bacterium]
MTADLVSWAEGALQMVADPAKAVPMAAYMKTTMAFYGVPSPLRLPIARELKQRFPASDPKSYRRNVLELWQLPHREEKYLALDYAGSFPRLITFEQVDLYRQLVVEGAWWDLVDPVASHLVGRVVRDDRAKMRPLLHTWIDHEDLWLRRTALLCQLGHKGETDQAMLFDFCLRRGHEREFFIRKAIGWALREYARVEPEAVREFLRQQRDRLSPLSVREAAKHL